MYTTRFPHEAKSMQLKRQMVFESVDGGRIHEQTLDLELSWFAGWKCFDEENFESKTPTAMATDVW